MAKKETFSEAALHWDLETLYKDLASAKGKHLTPTEKLHLPKNSGIKPLL